ncbi:MAG: hypothetical protein K940chlam9_01497 [Chlamydiae bacterium]|nr:hypothetical protein [Chlamydiota bacterium]
MQILRKKRHVEGRYPNIFVSDRVAAVTNKKALYIKNRALNDAHYENLILNFINKYGSATREEINELILDKLPDILDNIQKTNKIGNILSKMRRKDLIKNQGSFKIPSWVRK